MQDRDCWQQRDTTPGMAGREGTSVSLCVFVFVCVLPTMEEKTLFYLFSYTAVFLLGANTESLRPTVGHRFCLRYLYCILILLVPE